MAIRVKQAVDILGVSPNTAKLLSRAGDYIEQKQQ